MVKPLRSHAQTDAESFSEIKPKIKFKSLITPNFLRCCANKKKTNSNRNKYNHDKYAKILRNNDLIRKK